MSWLYLDTSAVLRAVLESGLSPDIEAKLASTAHLTTSRLSFIESGRALIRLQSRVPLSAHARATQALEEIWACCDVWELNAEVCSLAARVAPQTALRTLDALHLATFLLARRKIEGLELLTADARLAEAAGLT